MPWLETSPMDQRKQFIADFHRGLQSVTELADRFEISRETAYKWIDRHEEDGANGLANRSRRPLSCPHETRPRIVDAVLEARRHHPRWREEAAPHSSAQGSARDLARAHHGVRPVETPRSDPENAAPASAGASRASADADDGVERNLDGGLQRAVQDPRRRVLLSAHA